jgi:hypothetical protein
MYANNVIGRRRPEGWVERRRYFKRLFAKVRPQTDEKSKEQIENPSK